MENLDEKFMGVALEKAKKCGIHLNNPNKWFGLLLKSLENDRGNTKTC